MKVMFVGIMLYLKQKCTVYNNKKIQLKNHWNVSPISHIIDFLLMTDGIDMRNAKYNNNSLIDETSK